MQKFNKRNYSATNKRLLVLIFFIMNLTGALSQVTVISSNLQSFNVTPVSLCDVNIMNGSTQAVSVYMNIQLLSVNNEILMTVKTNTFSIRPGLNTSSSENVIPSSFTFSTNQVADHLKMYQRLPTGRYKICIDILNSDEFIENWCDEIESDYFSFMTLVNPLDKDTLYVERPTLTWNCSEFPLVNTKNNYYKLILSEVKNEQSPDAAVQENIPIFFKNGVNDFQVDYPVNSPALEKGKKYAWQIFKISEGKIFDKTEAWEFVIPDENNENNKYAVVKKQLDGGYYLPVNNKIYFKFNEEYPAAKLNCHIYDDKRNTVKPKLINDKDNNEIDIKKGGDNRFEIDLMTLSIGNGFHILEIVNEKGEKFFLKFSIL